MPVIVKRLPRQPIVITTYTGVVTVEDVRSAFSQSSAFLEHYETSLYRIIHIEDVDIGFADVLHFAQTAASGIPGAISDQCFKPIVVGHDRWTKLYVQLLGQKQFGGVTLPCFVTLEQALEYIEAELAKS